MQSSAVGIMCDEQGVLERPTKSSDVEKGCLASDDPSLTITTTTTHKVTENIINKTSSKEAHGNGNGNGNSIRLQRSQSQSPSPRDQSSQRPPSLRLTTRIRKFILKKSGEGEPIDTSEPPDGGVQAWTLVILGHFLGFHTWGFLNSFGVLQTYYVSALHQTPSNVSWIGSLQAFFLLSVSAFVGRLTDAGYFRQLLFVGSTLQIVGFLAVSFAREYWQVLLCHGLCIGLGGGILFIPSVSVVATYFRRNRPVALALLVLGNSAGGLFYAAVLQNALPKVGYAWTMRICGAIMLATFVPANFLIKERRIERKPGPIVEWKAFVEPAYGTFTAGMFCSNVGMWIPVFYLGAFGRDVIGIPTHQAANLLLLINGVGFIGRLVPTALTPSCGPLNLVIPLTFFSSIVLFSWLVVKDRKGTFIFDIFYGIFMAAAQGLLPPCLGSLTHDLSKMGVRLGMVFSVLGFALLIGNPFAGWLISINHGNYLYAQLYAAVSMLIGAILLAVARYHITGKKFFVKV